MKITNQEQFEFFKLWAIFMPYIVKYCIDNNMIATWGDAYRDPRCPYGSERSMHHKRMAIDVNLIKDGKLIHNDEGHKVLGKFLQSLGGTWGGGWSDFNHYSYLE